MELEESGSLTSDYTAKLQSSKQYGADTLYQPEWPSSKNLQTISAGEGVEKKEPDVTVGGIVNWHNHCGKQYGDSSVN